MAAVEVAPETAATFPALPIFFTAFLRYVNMAICMPKPRERLTIKYQ